MEHGELKYKIFDLNRIVDEKGSTFIALRKIAWNVDPNEENVDESKIKLDLRKYYSTADGGERMNKGVSFLTEDGPNELIKILLEEGYGDTKDCMTILKSRSDFKEVITFLSNNTPQDSEEYFDPRELLENL